MGDPRNLTLALSLRRRGNKRFLLPSPYEGEGLGVRLREALNYLSSQLKLN
jgi:hypothetical protein